MLLRISNIILSVVMVSITTGFSVSKHFCHDRLVNTGLFSVQSCREVPESCCDGKQVVLCDNEIDQDDCCKNESTIVKFTEQFTVSQQSNSANQQFIALSFVLPDFLNVKFHFEEEQGKCRIVRPPPLIGSIFLFVRSFLI